MLFSFNLIVRSFILHVHCLPLLSCQFHYVILKLWVLFACGWGFSFHLEQKMLEWILRFFWLLHCPLFFWFFIYFFRIDLLIINYNWCFIHILFKWGRSIVLIFRFVPLWSLININIFIILLILLILLSNNTMILQFIKPTFYFHFIHQLFLTFAWLFIFLVLLSLFFNLLLFALINLLFCYRFVIYRLIIELCLVYLLWYCCVNILKCFY